MLAYPSSRLWCEVYFPLLPEELFHTKFSQPLRIPHEMFQYCPISCASGNHALQKKIHRFFNKVSVILAQMSFKSRGSHGIISQRF
jgi:hypothetical protein